MRAREKGWVKYVSGDVMYAYCGEQYFYAIVRSSTNSLVVHTVIATWTGDVVCSCMAHSYRGLCSHIWAAYFWVVDKGCDRWINVFKRYVERKSGDQHEGEIL